jgi:iron complex transport system ATP-binding protein
MLSVKNVSVEYRKGNLVLHDVGFEVRQGKILAILGPNGAGKTTLLRCMNSILKPNEGVITVEGVDLMRMNARKIAQKIGYVAQQHGAGALSVFDAVLLGRKPHLGLKSRLDDFAKVRAALHRLELQHLAMRHIDQLSGGELQKVCIARAFVQEPRIFLLDEPTSSLDLKNQLDILGIIRRIIAEHPISVVMTMHDLNLAFKFADQLLFLKNGGVAAYGTPDRITASILSDVYGIKVELLRYNGHTVATPAVQPTEKR